MHSILGLIGLCFVYATATSLRVQDSRLKRILSPDALETLAHSTVNEHGVYRPRRQVSQDGEPPQKWSDEYFNHRHNLTRVYLNTAEHLAVYFDSKLKTNPEWLFSFTTQVWAFMTKTYGPLGSDPYLYVIIYENEHYNCRRRYSLDPQNNPGHHNVLDCGSAEWMVANSKPKLMDMITNHLAFFVEMSSNGRFGSSSSGLWTYVPSNGLTAWADIFTYDVYTSLKLTGDSNRYMVDRMVKEYENPKRFTNWFKAWFVPIHTKYGGSQVLNKYFQLLSEYFPTNGMNGGVYSGSLKIGGFVHFWSGAAREDLSGLAKTAFDWNGTYQEQLDQAIVDFPNVHKLYNCSNCATEDQQIQDRNKLITISVPVIALVALMATALIIYYKRRLQNLKMEITALTNQDVKEFFEGDPNVDPNEAMALVASLPFVKDFEIPRDQIILAPDKGVIGSGQFGSVIHGLVRLTTSDKTVPVAMKMMKPNIEIGYFKAFLSEVKIMAYLGKHENIVTLIGTCTTNIKNGEIFIAMEFCPLGNLGDYLNKNQGKFHSTEAFNTSSVGNMYLSQVKGKTVGFPEKSTENDSTESDVNTITTQDLLKWSQEIANAMVYISEKKVIHGDLAARNILLTENCVAKISDFGLSRQFLNYENYMKTSKTPVPWRWLAIEAMKEMKFSVASDVWAFGVTLWEIFSLGETPYGAWTYDLFFADKLITGDRLLRPTYASPQLYALLLDCWQKEPENRPTFHEIHRILGECISKPKLFGFSGLRKKPSFKPTSPLKKEYETNF